MSAASSASASAVSGVCDAGLSTTVLPAARAGPELPDRHHQRVVPRRDLADDAYRLPADHAGVALRVFARRLALDHPRGTGKEAHVVDREVDVEVGHALGLADVVRLESSTGRPCCPRSPAANFQSICCARRESSGTSRRTRRARRPRPCRRRPLCPWGRRRSFPRSPGSMTENVSPSAASDQSPLMNMRRRVAVSVMKNLWLRRAGCPYRTHDARGGLQPGFVLAGNLWRRSDAAAGARWTD